MGKKKDTIPCGGCNGSGLALGNAVCSRCRGSGVDPYASR
jgi:DnaJ-class molecular chaperone